MLGHSYFCSDKHIANTTLEMIVGGEYSVEKYYYLEHGYGWWADVQPSDDIKMQTEKIGTP